MNIHIINRNLFEHQNTISTLIQKNIQDIHLAGDLAVKTLLNGGTIFWCGNGGSASDCQHLAAELVGRFKKNRKPLRSIAITTDSSVLTCVANDFSYKDIFSRQLEALAREGDLLIAISTSGNSENIIEALFKAKEIKLETLALLGKDGGQAKNIAKNSIIISSQSTARIQESHILIGHILCELIENGLGLD
jgi:D-sedoheptulose 7-phosphate isomerase